MTHFGTGRPLCGHRFARIRSNSANATECRNCVRSLVRLAKIGS